MTINTLSLKEVEDTNTKIEEDKKLLEECRTIMADARVSLPLLREKIKDLQEDIVKVNTERELTEIHSQKASNTVRILNESIEIQERELAKDKVNNDIKTLYEKQKSFWDALGVRISQKREELTLGLVGMVEPKKVEQVITELKAILDAPRSFGEPSLTIRNYIGKYEETLVDMCQMQIEGRPIPVDSSQRRLNILDGFLMAPVIQPYWS